MTLFYNPEEKKMFQKVRPTVETETLLYENGYIPLLVCRALICVRALNGNTFLYHKESRKLINNLKKQRDGRHNNV